MLPPVGHDAQSATPLALDTLARGRVHRGVSEDWYRLELPEGTQSMRVDFAGDLAPEVAVVLADAGGREIPLVPDADSPGTMTAPASPGTWTLRVHQPPQSIVASWDTSASVSNFIGSITRVVQRLTWELRSDREQINLVPFRGPSSSLLMESWSGDPAVVYGALHAYPWADGSSDAESALNAAVHALERRVGSRAVVIITDANFGGVFLNEMLWESLGRSRTKVFALHLPIEYDPVRARAQANLMLDWSQAAGGYYTRFASQGDAEAAFRRMSAWLRRPAVYAFTVAADTAPPPPGQLIVEMRSEAAGDGRAGAASGAVEIVLDASGSMLQRLDGVRRIEIARQALAELADAGLPPGTQLALRVFGQGGAGSCASDLVLPPEPFNAAAFNAAIAPIQPVNRAKTPIGDSLRLAGADLAGLAGRKLIVLVTDGEETCGGDPAGEIAALRAAGLDARVNIVGFAVDDPALKETFAAWAATGGGGYFDAGDAVALSEALQQAVTTPFDILGADGSVVASGIVGGPAIELPPGDYTISIGGKDEPIRATITSGGTTTVAIATTGGEAIP
jgi:Mg-chelatase subunit ChlD